MSLLAIGSVAFDTIETPTAKRERVLGGSGTYFSYAASFFTKVRLIGIVGKDWPESYSRLLADREIDLSGLVRDPTRNTYFWHGRYTPDLQDRETLVWEVNGFDEYKPVVPPQFQDSKIVFLGAAAPNVQLETLAQCSSPKLVVADTVDAWIESSRDELVKLLARIDCLLINDAEARQFTGEQNLVRASKHIQAMGPHTVIIKKGEHGCLLFSGSKVAPCPAFPVENVIDPTGAGDCFAGGMVGTLAHSDVLNELAWLRAIQVGTVVASFAVEGFSLDGLQGIQVADIQQRLNEFHAMLGSSPLILPS
jgi:cytidine kinase